MIGAQSCEVTFTSGGTESNHLAIWTAIQYGRKWNVGGLPHVITTNIEHCAITKPLRKLEEEGMCTVDFIPAVKGRGCVCVDDILRAVTSSTCLVTVMAANNETGVIQPVSQIGSALVELNKSRPFPILFHTDAAQAVGKVQVQVQQLKVDLLTLAGHKFYGPRIGALYHRRSDLWSVTPMLLGGGQEMGIRSGTENTPMIIGLGIAALLVTKHLESYAVHMKTLRDFLRDQLIKTFCQDSSLENPVLGLGQILMMEDVPILPNTLSLRFGGISGVRLLELTQSHLIASTGAACHVGGLVSSVIMNSWKWDEVGASQTVRLSVGRETSKGDITRVVDAINTTIQDLKQSS